MQENEKPKNLLEAHTRILIDYNERFILIKDFVDKTTESLILINKKLDRLESEIKETRRRYID